MTSVQLTDDLRALSFEELGFYLHIVEALGDGPLSFKELEGVVNTHRSTAHRLLKRLKHVGLIEVIKERAKGRYSRLLYSLPGGAPVPSCAAPPPCWAEPDTVEPDRVEPHPETPTRALVQPTRVSAPAELRLKTKDKEKEPLLPSGCLIFKIVFDADQRLVDIVGQAQTRACEDWSEPGDEFPLQIEPIVRDNAQVSTSAQVVHSQDIFYQSGDMKKQTQDKDALPPLLGGRQTIPLDPKRREAKVWSMVKLYQFQDWFAAQGLKCDLDVEVPKFAEYYAGESLVNPFRMLRQWLQSEKCSHHAAQLDANLEAFVRGEF